MKEIIILGASGSIGRQTLDVIRNNKDKYKVKGLSLGRDLKLACEILNEFKVEFAVMRSKEAKDEMEKLFPNIAFSYGEEGLIQLATYDKENKNILLVVAVVGSSGLKPTVEAIKIGRNIALANKETLVTAGEIVMDLAKKNNVTVFPIDSEHSAIYQSIVGERHEDIKNLIITASGGSFRDYSRESLVNVTKEDALKHPNWNMGAKITIDSSTMMNKGFEVIEAHHLFDIPYENIKTLLHKESIVHSLVEFKDSSIKAQLGVSDMRIPILYALSYPERLEYNNELNLINKNLSFSELSSKRFPCLHMAIEAGKKGNIFPTVLNAANEASVALFLNDKIAYLDIEKIIEKELSLCSPIDNLSLEDILRVDKEIKEKIFKEYGGCELCQY